MNQNDLDKLKLLSNNLFDYLKAVLVKFRDNAIKNGHDMSEYHYENCGSYVEYLAHCRKCPHQIIIEHINFGGKAAVYYDLKSSDEECVKR